MAILFTPFKTSSLWIGYSVGNPYDVTLYVRLVGVPLELSMFLIPLISKIREFVTGFSVLSLENLYSLVWSGSPFL